MTLEVPIDNPGGEHTLEVAAKIGGKAYTLRLRWSEMAAAWSFDLDTESGESIITGRLVTLQRNLLAGAVHPDTPEGFLVAARSTESAELPTLANLGSTVRLYHVFG